MDFGEGEAEKERTKWATLALYRFILASLVLYVHLGWVRKPNDDLYVPLSAVVCFLVISGYSIAASLEREKVGFYRRRFGRIYPTYLVALVLCTALGILGTQNQIEFITLQCEPLSIVGSFLMLQGFLTPIWSLIGPSWSLSLEVFYYVIAPWLVKLRLRYLLGLWAASVVFYLIHAYQTGENYNHSENGISALGLGWAWMSGFIYHRFKENRLMFWLVVVAAPLIYSCFVWNDGRLGVAIMFLTGVLLSTDLPFQWKERSIRVFNWLGELSYPLYICHFPVFFLIGAVMTGPGAEIVKPESWQLILGALITSAMILHFVDLPARRLLLRRASMR